MKIKRIVCPVFKKNNCRNSSKRIRGTFTEEAARADGQVGDVRMNNYV